MGRPKLGDGESERLQMVITTEELKAIEDWRYASRVPSKSEAIRRLCKMALVSDQINRGIQSVSDRLASASMDLVELVRKKENEIELDHSELATSIEKLSMQIFEAAYDLFDRQVERSVLMGGLSDGQSDLSAELERSDAMAAYIKAKGGSVMKTIASSPEAMQAIHEAASKAREKVSK